MIWGKKESDGGEKTPFYTQPGGEILAAVRANPLPRCKSNPKRVGGGNVNTTNNSCLEAPPNTERKPQMLLKLPILIKGNWGCRNVRTSQRKIFVDHQNKVAIPPDAPAELGTTPHPHFIVISLSSLSTRTFRPQHYPRLRRRMPAPETTYTFTGHTHRPHSRLF